MILSGLSGTVLACIGLAALIPIFSRLSGLQFPNRLVAGVAIFSATALVFGEYFDGYERVPRLDMALHAASCAVLAVVGMGLVLLLTAGGPSRTTLGVSSVLAFGFAMMVGAMWEVMEFSLDGLFGTDTQKGSLSDTMWDVIANGSGAALGALAADVTLRTRRHVPPAGLLMDTMAMNPVIFGASRHWERKVRGTQARPDGPLEGSGKARRDVVAGEKEIRPGRARTEASRDTGGRLVEGRGAFAQKPGGRHPDGQMPAMRADGGADVIPEPAQHRLPREPREPRGLQRGYGDGDRVPSAKNPVRRSTQ